MLRKEKQNVSFFFSQCPAGGNIWSFLTNAPQGNFFGKNDPRFLGSLLKKIIRQRKKKKNS
jgi:hypothetical protein